MKVYDTTSSSLRSIVQRNRRGEALGTYAVCSTHPAVLDAALQQALADGTLLHVESTCSQVNQFGGYTETTPAQFADQIRRLARRAGLQPDQVLLGTDHLGPYCWRSEPFASAMAKACELARQCVQAGYQKLHLDASMPCGGDPPVLDPSVVAARAATICKVAEEAYSLLPPGSPQPLYVIGTEVPAPGGEVAEGERPEPTKAEDVEKTLESFSSAFQACGLEAAWENVIGLVVQPGVEFGDNTIFDYDLARARHLVSCLPASPELIYEAHSTDYQTPSALAHMVEDHFAILKVGPWLTFALREAVFALGYIERAMPKHPGEASHVPDAIETAMLENPEHWLPYYHGGSDQQKFARAFSLSDRCRYYWTRQTVKVELDRLLNNLRGPIPLPLLSQYLQAEYEAIRCGEIENSADAIVRHHIQRVLRVYATACGARQSC